MKIWNQLTKCYRRDDRGFTAAEIITVVAIISILALIVIPKFWNRTEEARIARAKEEMARILDAESFCYAETGQYVQPGNLHSIESTGSVTITSWNTDQWITNYNSSPGTAAFIDGYAPNTVKNWNGPYITYQKTEMYDETSYAPTDPWKNPYFFFGPVTLSSTDTTKGKKIRMWSAGS